MRRSGFILPLLFLASPLLADSTTLPDDYGIFDAPEAIAAADEIWIHYPRDICAEIQDVDLDMDPHGSLTLLRVDLHCLDPDGAFVSLSASWQEMRRISQRLADAPRAPIRYRPYDGATIEVRPGR